MSEIEDFRQERDRQSQILSDAIQETISRTCKQFQIPMLNALASALVAVEAGMLSSISDLKSRKALMDAMKKARPVALDRAMEKNSGHAKTVVMQVKP